MSWRDKESEYATRPFVDMSLTLTELNDLQLALAAYRKSKKLNDDEMYWHNRLGNKIIEAQKQLVR